MTIQPRGDYIAGRFVRPRRAVSLVESRNPGDTRDCVGRFPTGGSDAGHASLNEVDSVIL